MYIFINISRKYKIKLTPICLLYKFTYKKGINIYIDII